jgi:hypothetical protein
MSEDALENFGGCLRMSEDVFEELSRFQRMSDNVIKCQKSDRCQIDLLQYVKERVFQGCPANRAFCRTMDFTGVNVVP